MKRILFGVIATMILASCSTVAFTGRKRFLLYSDSEISSLSDESYTELMNTSVRSSNTGQTGTVTQVGERMVAALQTYLQKTGDTGLLDGVNWSFDLVNDSQVNAFCLPSGRVVFYEGIMPYLDTPDLVAVVMGHEMGHVVARHGNERMSQQALASLVGQTVGLVVEQKTSQAGLALFQAAFAVGSEYGYLLPYSRKQEYEADEIGLYIMAIAGYDISQAPKLWEKMSAGSAASVPEFMSTHPSDANRIRNLNKLMNKARTYVTEQ